MSFWDAVLGLSVGSLIFLAVALFVAFLFEFINGFHDSANAVATVIYTRSLSPTPAVVFSGLLNFLGVLLGGTAVAFGIVNLLPVELLVDARSNTALVMVLSLLLAGVGWNFGTWYLGLPVSSSHTLIGAILGVGMANSLHDGTGLAGVNWGEAAKVGIALLFSPLVGFLLAAILLLVMKWLIRAPRLYQPPVGEDRPPGWIRSILIATCGGVSFAHGANDGQKGMGLMLLVLIGFLPVHYALTVEKPTMAPEVVGAAGEVRATFVAHAQAIPTSLETDLATIERGLAGTNSFHDLPVDKETRWQIRLAVVRTVNALKKAESDAASPPEFRATIAELRKEKLTPAVEFVPLWVVLGVALALGLGTTIGYKRIVVTVAEKIGKTHLTYAQGAAAQTVAGTTILLAALFGLPVSTTHVLSSGVAGSMVANKSGVQGGTIKKILLAWVLTLPACILLAGLLFTLGRWLCKC